MRKLPGTLSERGLANRVKGGNFGGQKQEKSIEKGTKTIKRKDSDFDTGSLGSNLYIN